MVSSPERPETIHYGAMPSDSVGYIIGAYNYGETVGATDGGKFVLALRKDASGKWLIAADLDNSNRR
jgi:hypothetical protein